MSSSRSIVDGIDKSDSASLTEQDSWGGEGSRLGSEALSPSLDSWAGVRFTRLGIPWDGIGSIVLSMVGWVILTADDQWNLEGTTSTGDGSGVPGFTLSKVRTI